MRALRARKKRVALGRFVAEGVRVVEDLLASELNTIWVVRASSLEDTERGAALLTEVDRRRIRSRELPDEEFDRLAATESPQGIIAVAETPSAVPADFHVEHSPAVALVLDGVQDPGNFGTLARSAEALGAAGLVALPGTVDPWNPKAVRAAAGSSFRLPIIQLAWDDAVAMLHERGYSTVGAAVGGRPVGEVERGRVALVVGNEGAGLSPEVEQALDGTVGIPLRGRAESLNVSAAAAILLYELLR